MLVIYVQHPCVWGTAIFFSKSEISNDKMMTFKFKDMKMHAHECRHHQMTTRLSPNTSRELLAGRNWVLQNFQFFPQFVFHHFGL
jgi:hypothetical protein